MGMGMVWTCAYMFMQLTMADYEVNLHNGNALAMRSRPDVSREYCLPQYLFPSGTTVTATALVQLSPGNVLVRVKVRSRRDVDSSYHSAATVLRSFSSNAQIQRPPPDQTTTAITK